MTLAVMLKARFKAVAITLKKMDPKKLSAVRRKAGKASASKRRAMVKTIGRRAEYLTQEAQESRVQKYNKTCEALMEQMPKTPTASQLAMIRCCASIILWLEKADNARLMGEPVSTGEYNSSNAQLRNNFAVLGLNSEAKQGTPRKPKKAVSSHTKALLA